MLNVKEKNFFSNKVTLIGMMGTGKSKFGRIVANNLNYKFYDVDALIEKKFKTTIKELFEKNGELFFRKIEKQTIKSLFFNKKNKNEKSIISLGGGGFDDKDTRELLLDNTNVIWLNTPINTLVQRVGDGSKRPMIKGDVRKALDKLLKKRTKFYTLSHFQINTDNLAQDQITEKIINIVSHQNDKAI